MLKPGYWRTYGQFLKDIGKYALIWASALFVCWGLDFVLDIQAMIERWRF